MLKWYFRTENSIFGFLHFVGWKKTNRKEEKTKKGKLQKMPWTKKCFEGGWEKVDFSKTGLFRELQTRLVFGWNKGRFHQHYLFWEDCPLYIFVKKHRTQHNRSFNRHMGKNKTNIHFFFWKRVLLEEISKRLSIICDPQKLCSAESTIFIGVQLAQLFTDSVPDSLGWAENMQCPTANTIK